MRQNKSINFTYIKQSPIKSHIKKQNNFGSINLSKQRILKRFPHKKSLTNLSQCDKLDKSKQYENTIQQEDQLKYQSDRLIKINIKSPKNSQNKQNGTFFIQNISTPKKIKITPQNSINTIQTFRKMNQKYQRSQNTNSTTNIKYKSQKNIQDSTQYYKYWKNKANQYQQNNFILLKNNSQLKQQIQTLRQQNRVLKNNLQKITQNYGKNLSNDQIQPTNQTKQKTYEINQKRTKQLQSQLIKQNQLIKIQQQKINKHCLRLEQLSNSEEQNRSLKALLSRMEDKFLQLQSIGLKYRNNTGDYKHHAHENLILKNLKNIQESTNPYTISLSQNGQMGCQNFSPQNKDIQKRILKKISYQIPHTHLIDNYENQPIRRYTQDNM